MLDFGGSDGALLVEEIGRRPQHNLFSFSLVWNWNLVFHETSMLYFCSSQPYPDDWGASLKSAIVQRVLTDVIPLIAQVVTWVSDMAGPIDDMAIPGSSTGSFRHCSLNHSGQVTIQGLQDIFTITFVLLFVFLPMMCHSLPASRMTSHLFRQLTKFFVYIFSLPVVPYLPSRTSHLSVHAANCMQRNIDFTDICPGIPAVRYKHVRYKWCPPYCIFLISHR